MCSIHIRGTSKLMNVFVGGVDGHARSEVRWLGRALVERRELVKGFHADYSPVRRAGS